MTKDEIDEIRARCGAATPGPWKVQNRIFVRIPAYYPYSMHSAFSCKDVDAEFIAKSREDIPKLLDEVERLDYGIRAIGKLFSERYDEIKDLKGECEELRYDLERETAAHALKNSLIADLEAERDRYKARCDVLEEQIRKRFGFACQVCVNEAECAGNGDKCSGMTEWGFWQFDENRFIDVNINQTNKEGTK